jgi:hypothetical protein
MSTIDGWYDIENNRSVIDNRSIENNKNIENKVYELEKKVNHLESLIHTLTNENLKMVNRVLEAEIALERAKNSLIRNHIPFQFVPSPLSRNFKL